MKLDFVFEMHTELVFHCLALQWSHLDVIENLCKQIWMKDGSQSIFQSKFLFGKPVGAINTFVFLNVYSNLVVGM